VPPKMPPRFSLNIDLTLGVNAPLDNQFLEDTRTKWDPKKNILLLLCWLVSSYQIWVIPLVDDRQLQKIEKEKPWSMSSSLFGAKVDYLKKLIQRIDLVTKWCKYWQQFKSMANKKSCYIREQFQFLAHSLMCAQNLFM